MLQILWQVLLLFFFCFLLKTKQQQQHKIYLFAQDAKQEPNKNKILTYQ